ncbi:post-transcriptional regulator [Heyndrickxia acidiproducens]|uniref:post-transcriptional regulator n=1 Tax=Heyndrickxia acidiproducens TaxID=1121084 RepID=UPI00035D7A28|nr:post-transcriptional regulator [Heyndrickxia acidiproducens]
MQEKKHPYAIYYDELLPVLESKAEEFKVVGYGAVGVRELWRYLEKKVWKKVQNGDARMYSLVSDILSIKAGDFMNFMTMEAYRSPNLFAEMSEAELDGLLHPNQAKS